MDSVEHADTFAALDLGSNSFHLVIARRESNGSLVVVDRLREMVRLAAGLDADNHLSADARERALDCLAKIGERLREIPARNVRVVGTNTLRKARDSGDFIRAAEAALNHRIEIVSGMEEARLIYLGVSHSLAQDGRRLVIDIGGGSTEFIVGEGLEPLHKASLHIGCVGHSHAWFADGKLTRKAFDRSEMAARIEIEPIESRFRDLAWEAALGASGTIKAVATTLKESGWTDGTITRDGLEGLRKSMLKAGSIDRLELPGVKPERHPVFPGGVAILRAAMESLGIEEMRVADGAMREGILVDLPGRLDHVDPRAASVERLAARFHADPAQAERVLAVAAELFDQARGAWALDDEAGWLLQWAARLHEIGLDIAHSSCHKHAAYIAANTDLAGFARAEQLQLATLIRAWRRKFPVGQFAAFGEEDGERLARLAVLLRIAAVLHRGRRATPLPPIGIEVDGTDVHLRFPPGWLAEHPLTRADLAEEAGLLKNGGFTLDWDNGD
ncbi:Ppx/GppA phosphatase family protein [Halofilum ochraceum]|uniref:Ppx/GppA phosphatase family protein n=1 Tax=Halofilum ochraceum TaxID=1611323 RepID=UPI0008DA5B53|nr:Ppx/GppA phosphatase family protein [Halofilum ochraceum]